MKPVALDAVRLNELDRDEFWDVARKLKPGLSRGEYEAMWDEFQAEKARRASQ